MYALISADLYQEKELANFLARKFHLSLLKDNNHLTKSCSFSVLQKYKHKEINQCNVYCMHKSPVGLHNYPTTHMQQ